MDFREFLNMFVKEGWGTQILPIQNGVKIIISKGNEPKSTIKLVYENQWLPSADKIAHDIEMMLSNVRGSAMSIPKHKKYTLIPNV